MKNKYMTPPVPWGPDVPVYRLIYGTLPGPVLSGNDFSIPRFYAQAQPQCLSFANMDAP